MRRSRTTLPIFLTKLLRLLFEVIFLFLFGCVIVDGVKKTANKIQWSEQPLLVAQFLKPLLSLGALKKPPSTEADQVDGRSYQKMDRKPFLAFGLVCYRLRAQTTS